MMTCPWCGSADVDCPMVDIGIGEQQVAPATCGCGASQFYCHDAETKARATEEEWKRGWWAPPPATPQEVGHTLHSCADEGCNICPGGLAFCEVCRRGESEFWDDAGKIIPCDGKVVQS